MPALRSVRHLLRDWWNRWNRQQRFNSAPQTTPQAHARSLLLLNQNLSPTQRYQYEKYGYFEVIGGRTGKHYRITNGYQMNVEEIDKNGCSVCSLCFIPKGGLVVGDIMLAQKLALELFETHALKVANRSRNAFGFFIPGA